MVSMMKYFHCIRIKCIQLLNEWTTVLLKKFFKEYFVFNGMSLLSDLFITYMCSKICFQQ